jgi:hypothetical protein
MTGAAVDDLCLWCHHLVEEHDEVGCAHHLGPPTGPAGTRQWCTCPKTRAWLEENAS